MLTPPCRIREFSQTPARSDTIPAHVRWHPSIIIGVAALLVLAIFVALFRPERHNVHLRCYFQDARGLKAGAPVRVAGVDVGSITSVRARPDQADHPAEVMLLLQTSYELKIPNDSVVTLETAGLLGETFAAIDIKKATGPPLEDGGTLKTREADWPTTQQILDCLSNIAEHKPCTAKNGK